MKETFTVFSSYPQMNTVGFCLYSFKINCVNQWYAVYTHWSSNIA